MNIAIIGSGGREHALCQKIYESSVSKKIICIPGNAGTSEIAQNISLDISNFNEILNTIKFFKRCNELFTITFKIIIWIIRNI